MYKFSVAAICKNDAQYIKEWLDFHLRNGVEHFYIYNNMSEDNLLEVLIPYRLNGTVDVLNIEGKHMQMPAYNHAVANFAKDSKYMAFIDDDEFLFSVDGRPISEVCDEIIEQYNNVEFKLPQYQVGAIGVNWRIYGTSGNKECKPTMLDNFTYRAKDRLDENCHVKSIVVNNAATQFLQPHNPILKEGYMEISENCTYIFTPYFLDGNCEKLRINHYSSRSSEDFLYKMTKRSWPDSDRDYGEKWVNMRLSLAENEWNEVYDPIITNR